jgi:hypothetical protein
VIFDVQTPSDLRQFFLEIARPINVSQPHVDQITPIVWEIQTSRREKTQEKKTKRQKSFAQLKTNTMR